MFVMKFCLSEGDSLLIRGQAVWSIGIVGHSEKGLTIHWCISAVI
jgi:hypothetical protein